MYSTQPNSPTQHQPVEINQHVTKVSQGYLDFLNKARNKDFAQALLTGMEQSNLLKVCNYHFQGAFVDASLQFFEHATYANGVISSTVNDTLVEVVASDIRDVYAFPENALPVDDIMFDHDEFWRVVRVNELKVVPDFSGYKVDLKLEFELLSDVIQKCVYHLLGGNDKLSLKYARAMYAVFHGISVDWSRSMFERLCHFVKVKGHVGYGVLVCEILRRKGVRIGAVKGLTRDNFVLKRNKKRKPREMTCLTQGEGCSRPRRENIVDLNLPSQGGTSLEIVGVAEGVRDGIAESEQAERNEPRTTLSQVLESVGLNTPSEGLTRGNEEEVEEEQENFHVHFDVEAETRDEVPNIENFVEPLVEEIGELPIEEPIEQLEEQHIEHVVEEIGVQVGSSSGTQSETLDSLRTELEQHFEHIKDGFEDFNERFENSTKATNDKIQALSDKMNEMEKKNCKN